MNKLTTGFMAGCCAVLALAAQGTQMDAKAKVMKTVKSVLSGPVEITCDDPGAWTFDVTAGVDDGRDVVTVNLSAPKDAVPPKFGVFFRVPGAGVRNVWNSDCQRAAFKVDPQLWWQWASKYTSQLAKDTPIAVGFGPDETAPVAIACSEAFNYLEFGLYADDRTCEMIGRCEFFQQPVAACRSYRAKILLDRRGRKWYETVRACSDWIVAENGFRAADIPEAAYDPLYSTWYAYLQDVHDKALEREARHAAAVGMKTMILDDGWQKEDSKSFYSATGDWMPVKSRFPDMKAHVAEVHRAGLKYMLWLGVPLMGNESKIYPTFKGKFLSESDGCAILDPRFHEVREYLIRTYERVVGDWGFDGVKLDFIDDFRLPDPDPALKENYAGRDYKSLPEAVDRLMKDILARLKAIKPDVLVEFRQRYMGPAMRQYGNMMRAADCPDDVCSNRRRICDLRLTSGKTAVHSDMLVWSRDETPEGAALPILSALFGTVQYSMILDTVRPEHKDVIRHWIDFSTRHRETLLKGELRPHHPESGYPWIEAESAAERIVAVYSPSVCADCGGADKTIYAVNATGTDAMLLEFDAPAKVELFDVFGRAAGTASVAKGISRVRVPKSGYLRTVRTGAAGAARVEAKGVKAGNVVLTCAQPDGWRFALERVSREGDLEIVKVTADAEQPAVPPKFDVRVGFPAVDVPHLWKPEYAYDGSRPCWSSSDTRPSKTSFAWWTPVYCLHNSSDLNRFTIATTECVRDVPYQPSIREETLEAAHRLTFFPEPVAPMTHYETLLRLDRRAVFYGQAIEEATAWILDARGEKPCATPPGAFDPLYSSWYSFHQNVFDRDIEAECAEAAKMGMRTLIVDDGWQTDDTSRGYAFCGDWQVSTNRFPDMRAHVRKVHALGFKYMVWFSMPSVGVKSANYPRFKGKYLSETPNEATLDPRFPEVRAFLAGIYEKAMREWDIDGFKLDFINSFCLWGEPDPAVAENYAGRDIREIPDAVEALVAEATARIRAVKPDALIEFRQTYMGPGVRKYGNMFRVADCCGVAVANRAGVASLRLTSGGNAVHSDMLAWHPTETPAEGARQILSAIFGTVQYSMMLRTLPADHKRMMTHWIAFSKAHEEALQHGTFRPHHPELDYPVLEGESAAERIVGVYVDDVTADCGRADRPVYVLNGSGARRITLRLGAAPSKVEAFDTFGAPAAAPTLAKGVQDVDMPVSGYLKLTFERPASEALVSDFSR